MADFMQQTVSVRYLYDLFYYIVLNLIMLNIVFGIIIDTFGEMRADRDERFKNTTENCFICSIDKEVFDRESAMPEGFRRHVKEDHRMWNYLFFIIHLWEQDKDDDDGLEWHIRRCVEQGDLSWFPIKKAMCLKFEESEEEKLKGSLESELQNMEKVLESDIELFKDQLKQSISDIVHEVVSDRDSQAQNSQVIDHFSKGQALSGEIYAERNITLRIVEISDLRLKDEELRGVSCRLVTEEGLYASQCVDVHSSCAIFEDIGFLVAQNVPIQSDKTFRIQILQGDSKVGTSKFIAIVEVSLQTLLLSEGLQIELAFYPDTQEDAAILVLKPSTLISENFADSVPAPMIAGRSTIINVLKTL
jgi:hypothetical protein